MRKYDFTMRLQNSIISQRGKAVMHYILNQTCSLRGMVSYGLYKIIKSWWKGVTVVIAHEKVGFESAIADFHHFSKC